MAHNPLPQTRRDVGDTALFPSFQREMNRLIDQFRSGFPMLHDNDLSGFGTEAFPALDISETDEAVTVSAEVPGMKEEDLDVSISGDVLLLKGEKSTDREDKKENFHLVERKFGSFQRRVPLGFVPDAGAVEAHFADGVLKLQIAKPDAAKNPVQKVQIKRS